MELIDFACPDHFRSWNIFFAPLRTIMFNIRVMDRDRRDRDRDRLGHPRDAEHSAETGEATAMQASFLLADEGLWAVRIPIAFRLSSDFGSVQNCPIFRLKLFFSNLDIPSSWCFEFWLPRYRERSAGIPGSRGVISLNWSRETKNNHTILKWREREREREVFLYLCKYL